MEEDAKNAQTQTETTAATHTPAPAKDAAAPAAATDELFKTIDSMLDKRLPGLMKSMLKDNGMEDVDAADVIRRYRENKTTQVQTSTEETQQLRAQNSALAVQVRQMRVEAAAAAKGAGMGLSGEALPYALKLADFSAAVNEKGEVDATAIETALKKVLEDVPALKGSEKQTSAGIRVGGPGQAAGAQQATQPSQATAQKRWNKFNR